MQVPSDLVAMGSVYVGVFLILKVLTHLTIYSENLEKKSEQRTKLTKTNVLIRMTDGINIKKRNRNSKYNKPLHRLYQFIQAMLSRNYWRMYSRMSRTEQFE